MYYYNYDEGREDKKNFFDNDRNSKDRKGCVKFAELYYCPSYYSEDSDEDKCDRKDHTYIPEKEYRCNKEKSCHHEDEKKCDCKQHSRCCCPLFRHWCC